jgi:hypothetical protein
MCQAIGFKSVGGGTGCETPCNYDRTVLLEIMFELTFE